MCDFQKLVPHIICNSITRDTSGIFTLNECLKDTKVHLKSLNLALLNSDSFPSEYQLILNRAGLPDLENFYNLRICAHHRNELGVRYYNKKKCESPDHLNELGSKFRNINLEKSQFLLSQKNMKNKTHCVGDAICRKCYDSLNELKKHSNNSNNDFNNNLTDFEMSMF
jgi:hypothetical protein